MSIKHNELAEEPAVLDFPKILGGVLLQLIFFLPRSWVLLFCPGCVFHLPYAAYFLSPHPLPLSLLNATLTLIQITSDIFIDIISDAPEALPCTYCH
jgi:hypothetical protein